MGNSVSGGRTNDELVDYLVEKGLFTRANIERTFRAVDRGLFFLDDFKVQAYKDFAWREQNIHISAPSIYANVLEALGLQPGQSFLNIGSGTGYLSCLAGLMLGATGFNHNIELHKDMVCYARKCVGKFIATSASFDEFDFCAPRFVHGNCLNIRVDADMSLYDRVYVGAGVHRDDIDAERFFRGLLKLNGVLVMPIDETLVKVTRTGENTWECQPITTVKFMDLDKNGYAYDKSVLLPQQSPLTLQEICRAQIRQRLRYLINLEYPTYNHIPSPSTLLPLRQNRDDDNEDNNDEDSDDDTDNSIFTIQRLLIPARTSDGASQQVTNDFINAQIRLLVYGHLLDSGTRTQGGGDDDNVDEDTAEQESTSDTDPKPKKLRKSSDSKTSQIVLPNLLRERILQLHIPITVQQFLLYNRDI